MRIDFQVEQSKFTVTALELKLYLVNDDKLSPYHMGANTLITVGVPQYTSTQACGVTGLLCV